MQYLSTIQDQVSKLIEGDLAAWFPCSYTALAFHSATLAFIKVTKINEFEIYMYLDPKIETEKSAIDRLGPDWEQGYSIGQILNS